MNKRKTLFVLIISIYILFTQSSDFSYTKDLPLINQLEKISLLLSKYILNDNGENKEIEEQNLAYYAHKVEAEGFSFEEHKILTEDGYILTMWRIPGKYYEDNDERKNRKPILLQHGLFDCSYTWLMLNSTNNLALLLADKGYDVWISNSRGNSFSHEHINHNSNKFYSEFWDFTFHEMAVYDLPANINYIKKKTNYEKIYYLGHSQGTVQYFIYYTINPEFIENSIEKFISIGTVVNVFNTTSKIVQFLNYTNLMKLMEYINVKNMLSFHIEFYDLITYTCSKFKTLCKLILNFFVEDHPTNRIDYDLFFRNFRYTPSGTSARNVNHWVQFYKTKEFRQFDYGPELNINKYGQEKPPKYDLEKFKNYRIKSYMTVSDSDPFSKIEDCEHLFQHVDKNILKIKVLENYNHLDYLWSYDARKDFYEEIVDFLG